MRLIALAISLLHLVAFSQVTPEIALQRQLPSALVKRSYMDATTATRVYADSLSVSAARVAGHLEDADRAAYPQEGRGTRSVTIGAESCQHIDERQTVWGDASFSTGRISDVRWCDVVDYQLLAPYVLGDDTGGDLSFRRYDFGAGYAFTFKGSWTLGCALKYRAELAWRGVDPRIKTIVSDLQANLGVAYRTAGSRVVGLDLWAISYNQNCDLDFYNPLNDINTLPLTGLATYYKRFAGNTNKNSGYHGKGFGASLVWASIDAMGLQMAVDFRSIGIEQRLRNFNNITMAQTATRNLSARVAYGFAASSTIKLLPEVTAHYSHRLGTENLFGTAQGASYNKIGNHSPYRCDQWRVAATIPFELCLNSSSLTLLPSVGCDSRNESRRDEDRRISVGNLWEGFAANYASIVGGKWLLRVGASYRHRNALTHKCLLPKDSQPAALALSVVDTYDMLSAQCNQVGAGVSLNRQFGKVLAGVSLNYEYARIGGRHNQNLVNASIEIKF